MKLALLSLTSLSLVLLAGCGSSPDDKVYGPEDYRHFSSYFKMDESTADEMGKDGGSALTEPSAKDPNAAILTADALPGDQTGAILTAKPKNSPGVPLVD